MIDFDPGPPAALARHFAAVPDDAPKRCSLFWYDRGPMFYRGRLNGTHGFSVSRQTLDLPNASSGALSSATPGNGSKDSCVTSDSTRMT